MSKDFWAEEASNVLKATIKRSGLTYDQLVKKLERVGVMETVPGVKNKLARGTFSFVFVLQVLRALDKARISVD